MDGNSQASSAVSNISIISRALATKHYEYKDVLLGDRLYRMFFKDNQTRWMTYTEPALSYPTTHGAIRYISMNKSAAYDLVKGFGYSTPLSIGVSSIESIDHNLLDEIFKKPSGRAVVKPVFGSLSRGVVRDITTKEELLLTAENSLKDYSQIIVQEQVAGDEVRLVVIEGRLVAAILRKRPSVVGDGVSTIHQLIVAENENRKKISKSMVTYPQLTDKMLDPQLDRDKVLDLHEESVIGYGSMIMNGASMYDVTRDIHDGYRSMAEELAKGVGAGFIVIDVMVEDVSRFDRYWFIEFNTSPILKLFYSCRDGNHFDVARHLAEYIDRVTGDVA